MVSADVSLDGIEALKGKTVYLTGKGTTPDYVLHYILEENGIREGDITLEYKSEAAEVAAALAGKYRASSPAFRYGGMRTKRESSGDL